MVIKYDIAPDELVLFLEDKKYITGYVKIGGYDTENPNHVKINREILPAYFFDDFMSTKYLYYSYPEEVIPNKNFVPPKSSEDDDYGDYVEAMSQNRPYVPKETVPKEDYDELKERMDRLEAMMKQLLSQKG